MNYKSIIESKYNRQNWQELLYDIFRRNVEFWQEPLVVSVDNSLATSALYLGKITLHDGNAIAVYEVELSDSVQIERNRAGIRNLLCSNWRNIGCTGAFMFCYRRNEAVLRFSYVSESLTFAEDGTLKKESTDTKRFTYLLGEGHRSRTAIEQFEKLRDSELSLKDITKAFSIEALGDLFFKEYKKQYEDIIEYITGKRMVKVANKWEEQTTGQPCLEIMQEFAKFDDAEKSVRDYVKKLMGRLVFIQFLQKKGWMGCPAGDSWEDGDKEFLQNLFANSKYKETFVDDVLEPLFDDINTKREDDLVSDPKVGTNIKVPYLNGGLFWLALIVDEDHPHALPNMDFKIMQGNSLLEQYEGVELTGMSFDEQRKKKGKKGDQIQFSIEFDEKGSLDNIQQYINDYYNTDNHDKKVTLRNDINSSIKNYILHLKGCTPDIQSKIQNLPIPNDKFFLWHIYFKEVFDKGGFDIVIGNPPYGAEFNEYEKKYIKATFKSYKYKFESYVYFIEFSLNLTNENGIVELITPTLWLSLENSQPIRKIVLDNDLLAIRVYGENAFESAVVNTCSFTIRKKTSSDFIDIKFADEEKIVLSKSKIINPLTLKIDYRINLQQQNIIEKIEKISSPLSKYGDVIQGITPYDKYRGQSKEIIKNRAFHSYECKDDTYGHWIEGRDLSRYYLGWSGEWLTYGKWLAAPREKRFFEGDRILFREIPGNGKRIQACITNEVSYYGHSISPFKPYPEYIDILNFILAIVNSKLISWYGALLLPNLCKDIFPKVNPKDIGSLPIPNCIDKTKFISIVNDILSAKKANPEADTTELESEIDRMVYELYGLTEEEIAIVEGRG